MKQTRTGKNPYTKLIQDPEGTRYKIWIYFADWEVGKRWFVKVELERKEGKVVKKFTDGVNKIKTVKERRAAILAVYRSKINLIKQGVDLLGLQERQTVIDKPTLQEQINQELAKMVLELKKASVATYRAGSNHLLRWADSSGIVFLDQITPAKVQDFKAYLQQRIKGHKSINGYMASNSAIFTRILGEDKPNPFHNFKRLKENNSTGRNVPYRPEHLALIKEYCQTRPNYMQVLIMIQGMYFTGLRISELLSLRKRDFDLAKGILFLKGANAKTMGGGTRFSPKYRELLAEYLKEAGDDDYLFGYKNQPGPDPATDQQIRHKFERMRTALELDGFGYTLYSSRHLIACNMADSGFTLSEISSFLRHTDTQMTTNYLRSMGRNKTEEFFENFPEFE